MADRIEVTLGVKINGQAVWGGPIVRVVTVEESRTMSFDLNGGDTLPPTRQIPDAQLLTADVVLLRTGKPLSIQINSASSGVLPLDADAIVLVMGATGMEPTLLYANTGTDPDPVRLVLGGQSQI